jgi:hypothetical protein
VKENIMTKNNDKRPTHAIWQVIGDNDKARWIRVGAAWANRDGKGLTLKFDAYPVVGRTVVREFSEQQPEGSGGQ